MEQGVAIKMGCAIFAGLLLKKRIYYPLLRILRYMNETSDVKLRYSQEDLKEFEAIILKKLEATNSELVFIKETLSRRNDNGTDSTAIGSKTLEDGADVREKEQLSQSAARLQKFASQLEAALIRIKNGTYGVCRDTGELIPKERLRAVPHTQQTIEAKRKQN